MKELLELEYLKAQADFLDQKNVIKLKNEVRKLDALILDLMVAEQEYRVKQAVIE